MTTNGIGNTISDLLTKRPDEAIVLAGRYKIGRKLGEGGMGSVWLAEDAKLDGRKVAIKMLPVVLATNKRALQQLKAEAKVAMQLSHPNIVTLRSFDDSEEGAFLVMDYVSGNTLEDILADKGTLAEDEVLKIFKPIADALDYAHRQKVIHRDIKPSNILIREDGEPFIMDFGIAREMKDSMTRVTGRNSSGTLPYMSPEQLRGEAPTAAQDIYSLAVTIYECLSGHPPFYRGDIAYQIEHVEVPPLHRVSDLATTLMLALAKEAEVRPKSASEVISSSIDEAIMPTPEPDDNEKSIPVELLIERMRALDPKTPEHFGEWLSLAQTWKKKDETLLAQKCSRVAIEMIRDNLLDSWSGIENLQDWDIFVPRDLAAPLINKFEENISYEVDDYLVAADLWAKADSTADVARCLVQAEKKAGGDEQILSKCDEMWKNTFGGQWASEKKRYAVRLDNLRDTAPDVEADEEEDDDSVNISGKKDLGFGVMVAYGVFLALIIISLLWSYFSR